MNKLLIKNIVLFFTGFCIYITIETIFRGYSFPFSGVMGGLSVILIDKVNDYISWDVDLFWQALYGTCLITSMEFVVGLVAKYTPLLPVMWDYSSIPFNIYGVICLPFSIAWFFLSIVAIFLADAINYYIFDDTVVPYYNVFGNLNAVVFHKK
ncbi:MAG: hypothetical protein IKO36_01800 [Bacteroidaceae bacterium]|nr:hypothetical protein [Bacteroidaceae bacterium]